jgi:anti-sigma factor RsiW
MISLAIEGDLPQPEQDRLDRHLGSCSSCRDFWQEMLASQHMLGQLRFSDVEDERLTRVRAGVRNRVAEQKTSFSPRPAPDRFSSSTVFPRWALAGASILVIAVVLSLLLVGKRTEAPDALPVAENLATPAPQPITVSPTTKPQGYTKIISPEQATTPPDQNAVEVPVQNETTGHAQEPVVVAEAVRNEEPTVLRLVSESEDVVIYWQVEPYEQKTQKELHNGQSQE